MTDSPKVDLATPVAVDYKRQTDIFNPANHKDVIITIAGAGNIGSHTALALARLGFRTFHIFDFDDVEAHNLSSQAYGVADVGRAKIEALKEQMLFLNPEATVHLHNERFDGKAQVGTILVSAVDSMEGRREISAGVPEGVYVVDGRMGGGQIEVWSQPIADWPGTLTRDADDDPCSARYISYTSYIIAGLIANNVKRHVLGQKVNKRILMHVDTLEMIVDRK